MSFVIFWWNTVIFTFWWNAVFFSNFGGTWSFVIFWWNTVIFIFGWSTVISQILKMKMTVFHQSLKSDHVPPKFEKRPCSTKIWKMTVFHQNFKNDKIFIRFLGFFKLPCSRRACEVLSQNPNFYPLSKDFWTSLYLGQWNFVKNPNLYFYPLSCSTKNFEKRPCSTKKQKWPCSTKIWKMTFLLAF